MTQESLLSLRNREREVHIQSAMLEQHANLFHICCIDIFRRVGTSRRYDRIGVAPHNNRQGGLQ